VHTLRAFTDAGFSIEAEEVLLVKHAGVELAPSFKTRLAVNTVPSISGFNVHIRRRVCTGEYPEG
jgi:hypothetical protein